MEDTDVITKRNVFSPFWLFLCTALTLLIFWLALMPAISAPSGLGWDKLNHAGAIAAITGLAYLSLRPRTRTAGAAFAYGLTLGILIEILQATVTTSRSAEWADIGADLIGAGSAWIIIRLYQRITVPNQ
jgi:hypothetical protein